MYIFATVFRAGDISSRVLSVIMSLILKFLEEEQTETEAIYRGLVGLGNLVCFFLISGCK